MSRLITLLVTVASVLALAFLSLSAYHWYRGASGDDAARMTIDDARVAVSCPTKPRVILDFVQRSQLGAAGVGLAEKVGVDWVDIVCEGTFSG